MIRTAWPLRLAGILLAGTFLTLLTPTAFTQEFATGTAGLAWDKWKAAMEALAAGDTEEAEAAFGELLELNPSAFRVALMADRSVMQANLGGPLLLLEQDYQNNKTGPNATRIGQLLEVGREQMNEADDGYYFASIGRFDVANANFRALINSEPDPVALLEFTERARSRRDVLIRVAASPIVGEVARDMLRLLARGETLLKADPVRIKENIERLGGPPRAYENALDNLIQSGEYAIPFMIQYLRDPSQGSLAAPILRAMPRIDRPALNPLLAALEMDDAATKRYLIEVIGRIGYAQAMPYLLRLQENPETSSQVQSAVNDAIQSIRQAGGDVPGNLNAAQAFYDLSESYYDDARSLAADTRLDTANVWYWRDDLLVNVDVPTPIFNEVMAMRTSWHALNLAPDLKPPLALWIAANFRREAQLPEGETDRTVPADFPPAIYFAQSAGAEYNLMALARALDDGEPSVALGAIEALRHTAGRASVTGNDAGQQPLAEALTSPDRMVRIRAALALGNALPTESFHNAQNLMPVLSEAVMLFAGARNALVVHPDAEIANKVAAAMRSAGYNVITDANLFAGLQKVQSDLPGVDVIIIGSKLPEAPLADALTQIRGNVAYRSLPVVVLSTAGDATAVRDLVSGNSRTGAVPDVAESTELLDAISGIIRSAGTQPVTPELGLSIALEAAEALRLIAQTDNPVFNIKNTENALVSALAAGNPTFRVTVAEVLGFLGSSTAQEAIAKVAFDDAESVEMRVAMFQALAEAAKRRGNLLTEASVNRLTEIAQTAEDMTIRRASSQALGALNLPGNPASRIVRDEYQG